MVDPNIDWGSYRYSALYERWPKNAEGEPEPPVLLASRSSVDMSAELLVNMLEAYEIPCLTLYPGDGGFGRVVLGMSGPGVDIYVPESFYSDAKELCNSKGDSNYEEL